MSTPRSPSPPTDASPGPGSRPSSRARSPPPHPRSPAPRKNKPRKATFAKKLRTQAHGMATFMVRADVATIDAIDAAVTAKAAPLTESMPDADDDHRRVHAVLLLAHPDATPETPTSRTCCPPCSSTYTPMHRPRRRSARHRRRDGPTDAAPIARLEGHGPVTQAWITRVLGPHAKFKITPVLDLAGQAPVDSYEIPDRHRQAVHLMTPADTFPFASSLSRKKQVDHTIPYDQGGEIRHRQLRPDDHTPPPPQNPRPMASPTTLPRHLHLARPPRRVLPRRQHRHPPTAPWLPLNSPDGSSSDAPAAKVTFTLSLYVSTVQTSPSHGASGHRRDSRVCATWLPRRCRARPS